MYLGIDNQSGLVYEGSSLANLPVVPTPAITQAKLIQSDDDWRSLPGGLASNPMAWVFREDSFDAVTRTRRGRLYYSPDGQGQPDGGFVRPHPYDSVARIEIQVNGGVHKTLYKYMACAPVLALPHQGQGMTLALGSPRAASAWRIVQSEVLANHDVMLTLKALSAFGILPLIDSSKIHEEFRQGVNQAIDRVIDSAFRETPISVIDHCRNAMAVVLSRWMVQQGAPRGLLAKDLAELVKTLAAPPFEKGCVSSLSFVVGRLHARGKGNEEEDKALRIPVEEDAELALQALGFALREIEWTKV